MGAFSNIRNVMVLLLLVTVIALASWFMVRSPAQAVQNQPVVQPEAQLAQVEPQPTPPFRARDPGEDQDEIDPEACATVVQKELEGPIVVDNPILLTSLTTVLREQMIIKIIQACNVDDEIRPPNLDRDLDVDIEVFSIICEKAVDLGVTARCEVQRVAQSENAPFLP